jgi:hypothetical protein
MERRGPAVGGPRLKTANVPGKKVVDPFFRERIHWLFHPRGGRYGVVVLWRFVVFFFNHVFFFFFLWTLFVQDFAFSG